MNHNRILILSFLTLFVLAGCSAPVEQNPPEATPPALIETSSADVQWANSLFKQGKRREAAQAYYDAGIKRTPPTRERLILQAIEAAALVKDVELMSHFYRSIDTSHLNLENRARYDYGKALIALFQDKPAIALDTLPTDVSQLSPNLAKKIAQVRYNAARQTNNPATVAVELIRLYSLTGSASDENNQLIWTQLGKVPVEQINLHRKKLPDTHLRGWFDLAYLKKISRTTESLRSNLDSWNKNYPSHLANQFSLQLLDGLGFDAPTQTPSPPGISSQGKTVAVLLPFNGRFSNVAKDLYQGIADAHRKLSPDTKLLKLDTSELDASVVYNQALQQSADFILGPFSKQNIASMARNGYLSKPALSLNYLPTNSKRPDNLFQIGLLPEDEAIQIAQYAADKGQRQALVMVPASPWGKRLETAFFTAYKSKGGEVIKTVRYPNRATNYSSSVAELMQAKRSAQLIFLAASPTQARSIYPAITKALQRNQQPNATDKLVVYATSHIHSGRTTPSLDNSLNDINYTEIPHILTVWKSSSHQYPRLYALGHDAFVISQKLGELQQGKTLEGKTGKIHFLSNGTLHRTLPWATFRQGIPVANTP